MGATADSTSLVGRFAELGKLTAALADARRGSGSVVLVTGEAGIGKTRLATEVLALARSEGFGVAIGRTWEGPGDPAFFVWTAAFSSIGRGLELPRSVAEDEASFAAIEGVARHARSLTRDNPVVLVLDDLQWADAASLHALRLLARNPAQHVLVVGTIRAPERVPAAIEHLLEDLKRDVREVISLTGLLEQDLASFASSYGIDASRATPAIHRACGGNPFFARELLLDEVASAALAEGRDPRLPRGASALLTRRLAKLGDPVVEILACAALGPQPLDVELVARALRLPREPTAAAFDAAQVAGFVVHTGGGTLRFAHDLMRIAAREQLEPARRAELHRGWARALEGSTGHMTASAYHVLAADPDTCEEAPRDRVLAAGTAAFDRISFQEAAELFELAAAIDERAGRHGAAARTLARVAEALTHAGNPAAGKLAAERAITLARQAADPLALASAAVALGLRRTIGTTDPKLIALLEETLLGFEATIPADEGVPIRCALEARLASALQPFVNPARALSLGRSSIERARATHDERLLARTIHAARPAFRILDDLDERLSMDSELLHLATKLGDDLLAAHARARLCFVSVERGDALALDTHLAAYQALATELHLASHDLGVASIGAMRATIRGETEAAQRLIQSIDDTRERWSSGTASVVDPVVVLRAALGVISDDIAGYTALATAPAPPLVRSMFALFVAIRLGNTRDAPALYDAVAERVLSPDLANYVFRAILANAIIALRDVEGAKRLYPMLERYRGRHVIWTPLALYDGSIDRLRGGLAAVIGDHQSAAIHFEDAIACEDAFLAQPFAERTRRERATMIRDASGPTASLDRVEERAARATKDWGLTRRQLEVVCLMAQGDANKTIGTKLGCAERTVEVHVTAVLRKAQVTSRAELIALFWNQQ